MKKIFLVKACLLFLLISSCGTSGGGIADLFIPNFSNLWASSRGTNFQFVPNASNVPSGTLTGDEDGIPFTGSFNSYKVEFTFTSGAENGVKYSGKIIKDSDPVKMELTGTNNVQLTLVKN